MNTNLYAVTTVFNPNNYKSRYRLYREFVPYMEFSGVKLVTVEIAFETQEFQVTQANNPWHIQLRTNTELWHKERSLNIAIQRLIELVPDAENICWIDADVRFSNPNWAADTVVALRRYNVVQCFSQASFLNYNHEQIWITKGQVKQTIDKVGYSQNPPINLKYVNGGHPGLAWAAKRSVLDELGGLIDFCIAGSGDTHMINAMRGDLTLHFKPGMPEGFRKALQIWTDRAEKAVKRNIGYVNGICYHYWHGASDKRGYDKRWDIVIFHKFDPVTDIYYGLNGLWKFTGNKPDLEYDIRLTMNSRDEDATA